MTLFWYNLLRSFLALRPLYHDKLLSIDGTTITFNTAEGKMRLVIKVSSKWNMHEFSQTVVVLP